MMGSALGTIGKRTARTATANRQPWSFIGPACASSNSDAGWNAPRPHGDRRLGRPRAVLLRISCSILPTLTRQLAARAGGTRADTRNRTGGPALVGCATAAIGNGPGAHRGDQAR